MKNKKKPSVYIFAKKIDRYAAQKLLREAGALNLESKERWLIRESETYSGILTISFCRPERTVPFLHQRIAFKDGQWVPSSPQSLATEPYQGAFSNKLPEGSAELLLEYLRNHGFNPELGRQIIPSHEDASQSADYAAFNVEPYTDTDPNDNQTDTNLSM